MKCYQKYVYAIVVAGLFTGCSQYYDFAEGKRCYNEKKYNDAFTYFQKSADSGNAQSQCYLGIMYEQGQGVKQDYPLAIKWYKESAKNVYVPALDSLGRLYAQLKDFKEAVKYLEKAAKKGSLASVYRMGILYENGTGVEADAAKAETMYKIAADRGFLLAQNALAYLWAQQNRNLEDAEKRIIFAIENNSTPSYIPYFTDTYGLVLYKQGKYKDAITQFEKAMALTPDNATIHNHLGDCYFKINDIAKAKEQWLKALDLKPLIPDDKLNAQIQAKLDAIRTVQK